MAKIKLAQSTYTVIPEGTHVFRIDSVDYDEDFGKITANMVTASGAKHTELFNLIKNDGEANEGALKAFSYFAKVALNDFDADEIDPEDLAGCYVKCSVVHDVRPHRSGDGRTVTFVNLGDKYPAAGFEDVVAPPKAAKAPPTSAAVDLDALLGR